VGGEGGSRASGTTSSRAPGWRESRDPREVGTMPDWGAGIAGEHREE